MSTKDHGWKPRSHKEIYDHFTTLVRGLDDRERRVHLGLGPDTLQGKWVDDVLLPKVGNSIDCYMDWLDRSRRTLIHIRLLKEAEQEALPPYIKLAYMLKYSPLAESADFISLGFPAPSVKSRHRAPVATTYPAFRVEHPAPNRVLVYFYDMEGGKGRGKPDGQHAVEIAWILHPATWNGVVSIEDLALSAVATHSPYLLDLKSEDQGKALYIAMRWENNVGQPGPWSPVTRAIVS
ncbi:MAG: hypothetical protein LBG30_00900 [Odoribacteraceae bacterium]|jgi:hypothetical protein|nr:hypothetical protein [Odoribacteraceae bacterium]